ncbi:MAG TPA: hypothetical protein V6C78_02745 [Crinalium sp.]
MTVNSNVRIAVILSVQIGGSASLPAAGLHCRQLRICAKSATGFKMRIAVRIGLTR